LALRAAPKDQASDHVSLGIQSRESTTVKRIARNADSTSRDMIIDIDNLKLVYVAVCRISQGWFDPVEMYASLKADGKTNSSGFWGIATHMLADMSGYLGCTSAQFSDKWDQRCSDNDTRMMGYHCTRHSEMQVFVEKGILPLSEEIIRLSEDQAQTIKGKSMWEYRLQKSPGPFFLLSYKCARSPEKHSFFRGPEILFTCTGHHIDVNPVRSVPLIIHCAIPYPLLSERDYLAFCVLRAYFNFLDPEDRMDFDGYSIDLKGKRLDPQHIVRIEGIRDII